MAKSSYVKIKISTSEVSMCSNIQFSFDTSTRLLAIEVTSRVLCLVG